jgi:predicted nucleic acid-binding Zn ribbon protein
MKLRRLIGPGAAIVFKGSGFYKTDYRSESYRKAAAAEKKTNGEGSKKGKSEEKSAGKTKETSGAKES